MKSSAPYIILVSDVVTHETYILDVLFSNFLTDYI